MGLLYLYLVAWIVGGVLLGARMLLVHRDPSPGVTAAGTVPEAATPEGPSRALIRAAAALIGFGMFGLIAEGLGLVAGLWTALAALLGGVLFVTFSQLLRSRL